jgi:hypothetical protein
VAYTVDRPKPGPSTTTAAKAAPWTQESAQLIAQRSQQLQELQSARGRLARFERSQLASQGELAAYYGQRARAEARVVARLEEGQSPR